MPSSLLLCKSLGQLINKITPPTLPDLYREILRATSHHQKQHSAKESLESWCRYRHYRLMKTEQKESCSYMSAYKALAYCWKRLVPPCCLKVVSRQNWAHLKLIEKEGWWIYLPVLFSCLLQHVFIFKMICYGLCQICPNFRKTGFYLHMRYLMYCMCYNFCWPPKQLFRKYFTFPFLDLYPGISYRRRTEPEVQFQEEKKMFPNNSKHE